MTLELDPDEMLKFVTQEQLDECKFLGKDIKDLIKAIQAKEGDKKTLMEDMSYLVMICTLRGTNMEKIENRTGEKAKRHFATLKRKYGIVTHMKSVPMSTPTLPRIMSLFPVLCMKIRREYNIPVIGVSGSLPAEYCFPGGGALMSPSRLGMWLSWYESFCEVVKIEYVEENAKLGHQFSTVPAAFRY